MLGIGKLEKNYFNFVKELMTINFFVGCIGAINSSAINILYTDLDNNVYYLDPHIL